MLINSTVACNILWHLLQTHLPMSLSLPRALLKCVYLLATDAPIVTPIVNVKQADDGADITEKVPVSFRSNQMGAVQVPIWCLFAAFLWLKPSNHNCIYAIKTTAVLS